MKIRSLTVGAALPHDEAGRASLLARLGDFASAGRATLEAAGFTVQTTRLATQPLERWVHPGEDARATVASLGAMIARSGIAYCSLGTIQAASHPGDTRLIELVDALPDLLLAVDNCFGSVQVGVRDSGEAGVNMEAVRASARVIHALAERTPGGFGNLRFAAASNCPPHVPFFPASYYMESSHNSGGPEFGLALEAADLAVRAFTAMRTHEEARANLLALLADEAGRAAEVCAQLGADAGFSFTGLDISMAPHPSPNSSIAHALELLMGAPLGSPGTLAAAAFVTSVLKEARQHLPTVGYSGLMLPVLEDQVLSDRAAEGLVTIDTLLLMSAVCGLGLDTLPLPGDVSLAQLEAIIFDMASLAVKLDKPLSARLLPVPGKSAGDNTDFPDFEFFTKGKVMQVPGSAQRANGLFTGGWVRFST